MSTIGIQQEPCPSRSPDGDPCMRAAAHLDPHRRDTDGRRWTGGVYRPAAWAAGYVPHQSSAHHSSPAHFRSYR